MANGFKFQPSKISEAVNQKLVIKRLPEWMQGLEQIQMFCDDIIQQWFNPADEDIVDGYIGDRSSPAAAGKIFLNESDLQRQDYQLSPFYVSRNSDNSVRSTQFYSDLVGYLKHYGSLTDNEARLLSGYYYSWTPAINPNKIQNYNSYFWDTTNEYGISPDYIIMERGALNGNSWSIQNYWYTVGQTLPDGTVITEEDLLSTRFSQAQAPIIEFNKNIELMNYGTKFRGVVDYLSVDVKPEDIVQKNVSNNVRIDGKIIQEGTRILFTSIGNPGENNRIYKVYIKQMPNGTRVYGLVLDEDEETVSRPTGEPQIGDVVYITKGDIYANSSVYWNGKNWIPSQEKSGINSFPLFQLYDKNGNKLNDSSIYPNSNFSGSNIFGFKINYNYSADKIYGMNVELSDYNYYVFENFLQTIRYTYTKNSIKTEIPGLYFYNIISIDGNNNFVQNLKSDWVRSTEESKQYVKQVPEIEKTSMYRVFNTVSELNLFKNPLENMYAYVVDTDSNYKYYKPENSTYLKWNKINYNVAQEDVYVHTFELAQQITPTNINESIDVYVDGVLTTNYTTSLNSDGNIESITLSSDISLTEDSIVEISTFSPTKIPNTDLGSYEIPINMQYNPYNEFVDYIDQSNYTLHFLDIIKKNITSGSINDFNNYETRLEQGLVDNSVGTKIIQNETSLLTLMVNTANENLDIFSAIIFNQNEYFRFKNKFNIQMMNLYNSDPTSFMAKTASALVDTILTTINVGKDSSFPFYIDDIGVSVNISKTYIPATPQFLGILKTYKPENATYIHAGKDIGCYNVDHMGVISKAYHVINGVDLMDDILYELETRIYNSIDSTFRAIDYVPVMDDEFLKPTPYFQSTEYSSDEYTKLELRGYVNFIATNGIDNSTHDYDQSNWMTWNYTGTTYIIDGQPTDIPARGSWRAIYTDMFGTYRPHTHPWEMFGFSQRPDWFNQEYEPTKVRLGNDIDEYVYVYEAYVTDEGGQLVPSGLWDTTSGKGDASTGTILSGSRAGQYPQYKRFGTQPFKIIKTGQFTTDNEEICTLELISPDTLGLISGSLSHIAEQWSYGDMGDMEFTYMNTVMYAYDKAMALLRAKPGKFANYFYNTKESTLQTIVNGGKQFLYNNTNERLDFNSSTLVTGEDNTYNYGYQVWISDYLTYQNKNITTNYGDILRTSKINIGHRIGGYTKQDQLTFSSDVFGLIAQENQHIGLVKSSAFRNETLSAIKIQWTGTGYSISGYDLIEETVKYKVPNKIGRRTSINVGKRSVVHYNEFLNQYNTYEYGTLLKSYQDVYTFLCGYGEYLEDNGWIFEDVDENGVVQDWNVIAKDFVSWSSTDLSKGDFISVSPSTKNAKFGTEFGSVQSVSQFNGGVWSLIDDNNVGIRPYEIDTSRIGNVFSVRIDDDSDKRMSLIRLSVVSYEHAVIFDDKTIFGNNIYIPKYGSIHEIIKMYGYITGSWNGRLEAKGFIILESGTLPNFEKIVDDFRHYYDNITPVDNVTLRDLSRHVIGFQTRDYISQMISNDISQVDFYKGFIREKGTNQVFERVLRVSKSYNTENYKTLQEWAFKIGEYGNIYGKKHLQFQLINSEFKQEPQLFSFSQSLSNDDSIDNTITYFGTQGEDSRWIARPNGNFAFPMRTGKSDKINLPDIGPVTLDEVSYSTKDFTTAYTDRLSYINSTDKIPESVWIFRDMDDTWNIYELVDTGIYLNSITPVGDSDNYPGQHCLITLSSDHNMEDGDYFYFVDTSEYMPDLLKVETQYFSTGNSNSFVIPLNVTNDITFNDQKPVLYRYVSRFTSSSVKNNYISKKYNYSAPESTLFSKPSTYNSTNNEVELYINIYDPINGVIPGSIMTDITYVSTLDPAKYNSDDESLLAWGSEKVGTVWWNTTNAFFMDYTRPLYDSDGNVDEGSTLEYKRYNWGKLLPNSEINVLEWVASPVLPYEWDTYCTRQAILNKNSTSWVPSGEAIVDYYSEFQEYNESTSSYNTVYYFWVKNAIYIPKTKNRNKSCNEISRIIQEPSLLNVPWFSPISKNEFIISGLQKNITDDKSILSITYQNDITEVVKHEQYQLCKEGQDYNFNPIIWKSLWNSLLSYEESPDGSTKELHYPTNDTGILPNQIWFRDVMEARRTFVDSANLIYKTINITTDSVIMSDVFNAKIYEENPNLIPFSIANVNNVLVIQVENNIFSENDAVLVNSNSTLPSPFNSSTVYFVHLDSNGNIGLMKSPSAGDVATCITIEDRGEGQMTIIKQSDYVETVNDYIDMKNYWELSDWYDDGYDEYTPYTDEPSIESANQKNYQEGDVIRIVDDSNMWTLYVKSISKNVTIWSAIGREDSTVLLNEKIYSGYTRYNSNGTISTDEENIRKVLSLIKNSFDTYQSRLVFDMVKYVHTEQSIVDWVFKTSYIYIIGLEQSLQQYYTNSDLINQITEYFEEVKPYRTKIRSQIEQKTYDDEEINGIANDLDPDGYIFVNGTWNKSQKDIWDYEYAQYNSSEDKWEIVGELPTGFTSPNRRFQESYEILIYDNFNCTPESNLGTRLELESVNNSYMSNANDILLPADSYKLKRYSFTYPIINNSSIENLMITALSAYYPDIDLNSSLKTIVSNKFSEFYNSVDDSDLLYNRLIEIYNNSIENDSSVQTAMKYNQYNTLANRRRLYTSLDDEEIAEEVGCPFKGRVLSDNIHTRLPFGFSGTNSANYGYILYSQWLYDKMVSLAYEINPTFDIIKIQNYLIYEYGLYPWQVDMNSIDEFGNHTGKNYLDTLYVLTAMRNTFNPEVDDQYEISRQILSSPTVETHCMVMIPRKLVKVKNVNTNEYLDVPMDVSLHDFMEMQFIENNDVIVIEEPSLDSLPIDNSTPLYGTIQEVITGIDGLKYADDINGFDNFGLESQTRDIRYNATGTASLILDPIFVDISEINPLELDSSQLRFTVNGYSYDSSSNLQLRSQGNFQIEGNIVQNPYNRSEAIVSIPRYDNAIEYMQRNLISKNEIRYSYQIKNVLSTSGIVQLVQDNDFKIGEKVVVFTPDADDYQIFDDATNTWKTILEVNSIKNGTRPIIFTVSNVDGQNITIDGLSFNNLYSSVTRPAAINIIRITNFSDDEFVSNNISLYSTDRQYQVSMMNYDLMYDRMLIGNSYIEELSTDEYDDWYISNEIILVDGNEVDHGFYMPIYGKGVLSELVRTQILDSLQIFVYEYNEAEILPVKTGDVWSYTGNLVDNVYINDKSAALTVIYCDTLEKLEYLSSPLAVESSTIENDIITTSTIDENYIVAFSNELGKIRNEKYILRSMHGTVHNNFVNDTSYNVISIILGLEQNMETYGNNYQKIPDNTFSNGLIINGTIISELI